MESQSLSKALQQFLDDLIGVCDDRVVRVLQDRGPGIGIDRDDLTGAQDPAQMLDGAGDAEGDIELWLYGDSGLPDLKAVVRIARGDRASGGAEHRAAALGEQGETRKGRAAAEAESAGENHRRDVERQRAGAPPVRGAPENAAADAGEIRR